MCSLIAGLYSAVRLMGWMLMNGLGEEKTEALHQPDPLREFHLSSCTGGSGEYNAK